MGTRAALTLVGTPWEWMFGPLSSIASDALAEIATCESLMSIYRPESDIGRLNGEGYAREIEIDPRTFEVLGAALLRSRETGGAFNVMILSTEQQWGFKTGRARRVPAAKAGPAPDGASLALKSEKGRHFARLSKRGVKIDLGGIAPGYAADRVVRLLRDRGVRRAMIDIGGECYCLGRSARGGPWRVGVRHPRRDGLLVILELENRAVATSGDYEDYFIEKGKRYSHIFNPRTGRPAESGVVSATVVADSCAEADALSTAMLVMGVDGGLALARERRGVECLLVSGDGELSVSSSPGMSNYSAGEQ